MNSTIDLLKAHRSIRQFQNRLIQPDLFEELIKAGQAAASSNFFQAATIIRVTDLQKRLKLASLANNQAYVETAAEFLVFCADMNRAASCCDLHGSEANTGFTEQFIIATVDAALVAQNIVVASESAGLGICYIGALRNNPAEVSMVLDLPHDTYPVFGLCLGWPDQNPEVNHVYRSTLCCVKIATAMEQMGQILAIMMRLYVATMRRVPAIRNR